VLQNVSHVTVMPYVALYVGCGGIISSAEAAYHGVPMILTSLGFPEKEWEAENLTRLGSVLHVMKEDFHHDLLKAAALRAMNSIEVRDAARKLRRMVRNEPGAEEAVNRTEEFLDW
jgi:UDP:flavonoid glycosyltransferase YjiC (YdhE family)